MSTLIRAELSSKNKYWINKHRHYELKHFCLQYPFWQNAYNELDGFKSKSDDILGRSNIPGDPTCKCAEMRNRYFEKMDLIRRTAMLADPDLASYIFRAVTENLSFTYLKTRLEIPCSRDTYYDRYRKFFWLLSESRK